MGILFDNFSIFKWVSKDRENITNTYRRTQRSHQQQRIPPTTWLELVIPYIQIQIYVLLYNFKDTYIYIYSMYLLYTYGRVQGPHPTYNVRISYTIGGGHSPPCYAREIIILRDKRRFHSYICKKLFVLNIFIGIYICP